MIRTATLIALAATAMMLVMMQVPASAEPARAFDHGFEAIEGGPMPLAQWRDKVLLVVNTASFCGYTPQYEGLQALWERYQATGLIVIGVPSNDFGGQEPKAEAEILGFCKGAFGVTFPLTTKEVVRGPNAHAFYRWAAAELGAASAPRWNFHKYLVGRDGRLIAGYGSAVEPLSAGLTRAIEAALQASAVDAKP
jgi:glutathione peroxidase